ncbi:MAG: carbamoyltransferase HypF, partial [Anaerolineales bacterium]|nr:carbamoyltransferase HypF [Anaerolineales bacterium]
YGYPFINCTHCGPRFTLIKDIPYDRPFTTMAVFPMCPACQAEYNDPLNRRFHAQPNACPDCGPQVWLETPAGAAPSTHGTAALIEVQQRLRQGQIVAIKGVGGFHLACDARNNEAVQRLREHKGRQDKPFAVMARDLEAVRAFAAVTPDEAALLTSKESPIVLLDKKVGGDLAPLVAPGQNTVGVMLPYSPLHLLLFHSLAPDQPTATALVMTSGNDNGEPIICANDEARRNLAGLADAFLLHDREIHSRCDDSVLRITEFAEPAVLPLRRSRGYAPFPIKLPFALPPLLAVGGELKATFCLASENYGYMSQHIGDMGNLETLEAFAAAADHFSRVFRIRPDLIACDRHPAYLSRRWAEAQGVPLVEVQHHHAHIAAVMAEHGLVGDRPVIGFSFDGTGYGDDGAVWGGELLLADYAGYERRAHLAYFPLAGGDAAVQRPYRLALAYLWSVGLEWDEALAPVQACPEAEQRILQQQLEKNLNVVPTSSMGRLFDLVAALCGVRQVVNYEGQAAMELEALADTSVRDSYAFAYSVGALIESRPVVEAVVADVLRGVPRAVVAAKFHNAVADLIVGLSRQVRRETGLNQVALSGGVFQNRLLLSRVVPALQRHNFELLTHRLVPPNDGGLALGQAVVAGLAGRVR